MKTLGLSFGALDLILTPQGEYVFLEVNPSGQWVWIEDKLDLPISRSIAEWLWVPMKK
jgi:glutathione synthase/RimK-type ligase-like ATP-grasp enzyme